jgi:hypothetical protein
MLKSLVGLFSIMCFVACGAVDEPTGSSSYSVEDPGCTNEDCPPDPSCTNEDCPPDPGCTNEDCPPDPDCTDEDCLPEYYASCCCFEDYEPKVQDVQRLCCCKDGKDVTCRLSLVHDIYHHTTIQDVALTMGGGNKAKCKKPWTPPAATSMPWWTKGEGCGWMNQIHKCGAVASSTSSL